MRDSAAPALLWFRQDLRLANNPALRAAMDGGRRVLPVFVLDEDTPGAWAPGGATRWWLHHSLAALAESLGRRGVPLVLRRGRWEQEIPALAREIGAAEVHAGRLHEPWARQEDAAVARKLEAKGATLRLHTSTTLFGPDAIRTKSGGVYGIFTPFARACRDVPIPTPLPAPRRLAAAAGPRSERLADWRLLPTHPDWAGGLRADWVPGEAAAQRRLAGFIGTSLASYQHSRDRPGEDGTSRLSPHLHFGELSAAQAWHAIEGRDGAGAAAWRQELLWREFAAYSLWYAPHLPDAPLRPGFAALPWRRDLASLHAWQRGGTGIPIVDAGMRQLRQTGWMHNRVRMIVASFLTKHMLLDWRAGEAWFWDTLVDADLANNALGWQWSAGSGVDAQPFFRIFNPVSQGQKFDPDGRYVRRWVPELADLPDAHLHAPWEAPDAVLQAARVLLGRTYPRPIVELKEGRDRALEAYRGTVRAAE
jgi:deoxyribodipyrimidine photo-lyase